MQVDGDDISVSTELDSAFSGVFDDGVLRCRLGAEHGVASPRIWAIRKRTDEYTIATMNTAADVSTIDAPDAMSM